jgi:hypothetical protein
MKLADGLFGCRLGAHSLRQLRQGLERDDFPRSVITL